MARSLPDYFLRGASLLLSLATICFAFVYGSELIGKTELQNVNILYILAAFICFLLFYVILSIHWRYSCQLFSKEVHSAQFLAFFASQPYKYLPTSLFTFSFRAKFAKWAGLSVKQSSYAQLIENGSIVSSGLIVGGMLYLFEINGLVALPVFLLLMASAVWLLYTTKRIRLPIVSADLSISHLTRLFLIANGSWLVAGCAFWLITTSLGFTTNLTTTISINAIAYVAGILAFFAPGGIGIREIILMSGGINSSAVVLWRLLTFVADVASGVIAMGALGIKRINK